MNRRDLLFASGLSLLATAYPRFPAEGQTQTPRTPSARLLEGLQGNRLPLTMSGDPAGRGWDWLVEEARAARFTLIGEEHGVAETAQFAAALFKALRGSGYNRMAIEVSPIIAQDIEAAGRRNGYRGIVDFLTATGTFTFYSTMREEMQFLADVVRAAPHGERVLWGLDREVFADRYLISKLEPRVPRRAREAFMRLKEASATAWAHGNPFTMSQQNPAVVSAVRTAWPNPDPESDTILRTLEESLAIMVPANNWVYSQRRAQWCRNNLAALLRAEQQRRVPAKVMMKFGYNHMIRGANYANTFDLGAMPAEVLALTGERAFHILVLPGPGSRQAVPGPAGLSVSSDEQDEFRAGEQRLTRVLPNANATGHEVIDLRALRPLAVRGLESWNPDLVRTIYGYDAAVIWKGAHASSPPQ